MARQILYIQNIPIHLSRRKGQKRLILRVSPPAGEVYISAPQYCSKREIEEFAKKNIPFINKAKEDIKHNYPQGGKRYKDGEIIYLWGKALTIQLVADTKKNTCGEKSGKLILRLKEDGSPERRRKLVEDYYRKELKAHIPRLAEKCENKVGVKAAKWDVRKMKRRWGSCQIREKKILLNLHLAKYPIACLESVMIHELVHLLERLHNRKFYAYMDEFCPEWRKLGKILENPLHD